jgi:hypothetical protein
VTSLFEQGTTLCLVGTRGIFGEGWDALSLNTLIDLTSVTTRTGVQQIRGRSLRLDPAWPRKVAHNWDVVCYSKKFDRGDTDLRRFVARHAHTWGIIVRSRLDDFRDAMAQAVEELTPAMPLAGQVVRGVAHVDMELAFERDAGAVSRNLNENYVRVVETYEGGCEVFVDYASPEDSDTFSRAYRELLGPLGNARYIIKRDSTSLRNPIYRSLWLLVRTVLSLGKDLHAYHPVPAVLASRKERAEALARYWKRYVGGGHLVYTRTGEGRRILLQARAQRRKRIRQMAFEIWK